MKYSEQNANRVKDAKPLTQVNSAIMQNRVSQNKSAVDAPQGLTERKTQ